MTGHFKIEIESNHFVTDEIVNNDSAFSYDGKVAICNWLYNTLTNVNYRDFRNPKS